MPCKLFIHSFQCIPFRSEEALQLTRADLCFRLLVPWFFQPCSRDGYHVVWSDGALLRQNCSHFCICTAWSSSSLRVISCRSTSSRATKWEHYWIRKWYSFHIWAPHPYIIMVEQEYSSGMNMVTHWQVNCAWNQGLLI